MRVYVCASVGDVGKKERKNPLKKIIEQQKKAVVFVRERLEIIGRAGKVCEGG